MSSLPPPKSAQIPLTGYAQSPLGTVQPKHSVGKCGDSLSQEDGDRFRKLALDFSPYLLISVTESPAVNGIIWRLFIILSFVQ